MKIFIEITWALSSEICHATAFGRRLKQCKKCGMKNDSRTNVGKKKIKTALNSESV